ncbi:MULTISPECIES: hypothetical protein [Cellulophaga]|uniref:hypothetical protein n=1 Tax=Cellulophaga TaxID=104264 RepID=UPI001C07E1A2|nr:MULTISPECIES: hypothetical protein [Cellulophaga]
MPLLLVLFFSSFSMPLNEGTNVYICKGKSSKKYHYKKACRGLSNCSTKTYQVPLTEAREMGRTLCGWED